MKRLVIFLLLFVLASLACNLPGTETSTAAEQGNVLSATASPTAANQLAATSTLVLSSPTPYLSPVPTLTPLPLPQTVEYEAIYFDPGGTWKETLGYISSQKSKTYMLSAEEGQVMSVAVRGGYFPLQIQGRDGMVLCPTQLDTECNFWRGTLPLTQDYFITVQSGGEDTTFTLRVAINPVSKTEQSFTHGQKHFTLSYPDVFAPADPPASLNNKTDINLALQLIDTGSYVGANLREAYFVLGYSSDPQIVSSCTELNQSGGAPETSNGRAVIGSYEFRYSIASGLGAGNIYDQRIYRAEYNNICYEIIYYIHSSNIGNYSPGVVKEFDLQGLLQKFNLIHASLQLK